MGSLGQGCDPRQRLSSHLPFAIFFGHSMPYMFAVGPPTSWKVPLNPGLEAMRLASSRMDPSERDTTVEPWCTDMAQKEHSP